MPAHGAYGRSAVTLSSHRIRCRVACILKEMNAALLNEQLCSLREGCSDGGFSGNANGPACIYLDTICFGVDTEFVQSSHNSQYERLVRGLPARS